MTRADSVSDDAEALRSFLQSHYGVTILMGDEISVFPSEEFELRVIPEGNSVFLQMLEGNSRYIDLLRRMDDDISVILVDLGAEKVVEEYLVKMDRRVTNENVFYKVEEKTQEGDDGDVRSGLFDRPTII